MTNLNADMDLVGYAQQLLIRGRDVWIARRGVETLHQIADILVAEDSLLVIAMEAGTNKGLVLAPGELAIVVGGAEA